MEDLSLPPQLLPVGGKEEETEGGRGELQPFVMHVCLTPMTDRLTVIFAVGRTRWGWLVFVKTGTQVGPAKFGIAPVTD